MPANEGSGGLSTVNNRSNRNGSSAVVRPSWRIASATDTTASATTSNCSTKMRMLDI